MGLLTYIASEWVEASLGEAGVLDTSGWVRSRKVESAAAGKIMTDSRPAQIRAAPVTDEIVHADGCCGHEERQRGCLQ